jgi:hypothetical protein
MGWTCSSLREDEKYGTPKNIQAGYLKRMDHVGDLDVNGNIILEWLFKK